MGAIQLKPVFAQWIQGLHAAAAGSTAPNALAGVSEVFNGSVVAVGGKVAAAPDVMGEEPDLGGVIDRLVRIRRHRVHVLSNDDAHGTADGEVDRQLGMPGIGHEVVKTVVTVGGREQQGITLLAFMDLLDGVTNAPVGPVHVTGNDEL